MSRSLLVVVAALALGCADPAPTAPAATAPVAASPAPSPAAELAALDPRTPVPLLPPMAVHQREEMRDHLLVVQQVTEALARDDLEAAATAAARLGSSTSMTAMCTHMGLGAPGFTDRALEMHRQADEIARAARAGDRSATLSALSTTLGSCTSCHAAYRQEVVDRARWEALTRAQE